jgi:hypothetical protein
MDILIAILLLLAAIILVFLIAALFIKRDYTIEREIVINKPKAEVFNYVKFLRNQDNFNKWVMIDPGMKKSFTGTDGTVGFIYAWDSTNKSAGKGEQEIKEIREGEKLGVEVRFEKPFAGIAKTPMITESLSANQTRVRWGMQGTSKYPMNFMNLFMEKILGKDLEASLVTLKMILEKR